MRHLVLVCLLTVSLLMWGQNAPTSASPTPAATSPATTGTPATPAATTPGVNANAINPMPSVSQPPTNTQSTPAPTPTNNPSIGIVTNGGFATGAPATGAVVTTPIISLQPAPLAPGATSGPGAGATNSTMQIVPNQGATSGTQIVPENFSNAAVGGSNGAPLNAPSMAGNATAMPELAGFSNEVQPQDNRSLAEIAMALRGRTVQTARVYTNADIARLNNEAPQTGAMPNSEANDANPNAGVIAATGVTTNPFAPKTGGQMMQQNNQGNPPAVSNQTQPQNVGDADQNNATKPSVNGQTTEQTPDQTATQAAPPPQKQQAEKLPATASPLPLLALFGLLAGGAGAVYRFRRRN